MSGAASAATIAAATTAAAIVAANATVDNPSHPARSANENRRDPQIRAFEQYLLDNLRQSDVTTDNQGVYLFNVNQVAYLVEGCCTRDEQRTTQRRVKEAISSINTFNTKCPRSGRGGTNFSCRRTDRQTATFLVAGQTDKHLIGVCFLDPGLPPSGAVKSGLARETTPDKKGFKLFIPQGGWSNSPVLIWVGPARAYEF